MDIVKFIGELLHENVLKDLEKSGFQGSSKELCKIHLTFECQRCLTSLCTWTQFVHHLSQHPDDVPEKLVESVGDDAVERSAFPLPPKKNRLARTEVNDERLRTRRSKCETEKTGKVVESDNRQDDCDQDGVEKIIKRKRGRPPKQKPNEVMLIDVNKVKQDSGPRLSTRRTKRLAESATDNVSIADSTTTIRLDLPESDDQNEISHSYESRKVTLESSEFPESSSKIAENQSVDENETVATVTAETDEIDLDVDPEISLEESESPSENLMAVENHDAAIADMLNVKEEEYAVMSRDQKEDLKARTCPFCYKVLPTLSECLPHYKLKHDYAPKACDNISNQEFKPNSGGRGIKAADTCDQCQFCGKYFLKDKIDRHVILVHVWRSIQRNSKRKKPSLCDICGQVFGYVHNLAAHRKSHFKQVQRPKRSTHYVCDQCGYSTPERKRLTLHTMSKHENKKAFKCTHPNCSYETWERSSYRCHLYKHSNNKQFKCSHCSYQCIQLKQLRNHLQKQHLVSLPKKYEVGVDDKGKKTVKIVAPRQNTRKNKLEPCGSEIDKVKVVEIIPTVGLNEKVCVNEKNETEYGGQETHVTVSNITTSQYNAALDPSNMAVHQEHPVVQEHELQTNMAGQYVAEQHAELVEQGNRSQSMDQEYYHQEHVISEEGGTPYMLLYPSDLGENTYTPVPQAVAEVLVTTNLGEQQVLHLYPSISKPNDSSHTLSPGQNANSHISMATTQEQEVSLVTNSQASDHENIPVAVAANQLHPVSSQVNFVPVINASDVISACSQPLVRGSAQHQHEMAAPVTSSHLVMNSTQPINFVNENQTAVMTETNAMMQADSFRYASNATFVAPNDARNIELAHVPMPYSELQRSASVDIDEQPKSVECVSHSENNSVEQDIARTLIQINDNHL